MSQNDAAPLFQRMKRKLFFSRWLKLWSKGTVTRLVIVNGWPSLEWRLG